MYMEREIANKLKLLGIPANLFGYTYLKQAISDVLQDPTLNHAMTRRLYPGLAEKFGGSPSRVERAIRHAIEVGFDRGNMEYMSQVFGYSASGYKGKATNTEFIATVAEDLRLDMKEKS